LDRDAVLDRLRREGTAATRDGMTRYGIPNDRAFGVPMAAMQKLARSIGKDHALAAELWTTGWYEARTVAVFLADPARMTRTEADAWAAGFDNWAIVDTAAFHLLDRTAFAWDLVRDWPHEPAEFTRRAGYALLWALSVHDKAAPDERFLDALARLEAAEPDPRPYVKKAADMALRATGKRNPALNEAALATARHLAADPDPSRAWIGRTSLRELESEKVRARLGR
jgi:3-methyladenine DNA glycosylase AlkD